jgi:tetratricopeptide (TPR) repeat protein
MRALAHTRRGQLAQAEPDARKAISMAPGSAIGYVQLGNVMVAKRSFHEGEEAYKQALQCDEASTEALAGLMNVYFAENEAASAFAAARVQIERAPGNSGLRDLLGTALFDHKRDRHDITDSEAALTKAVDLDAHNVDAWLKLIQVRAVGNSAEAALETSRQAIEQNMDAAGLYVLRGELYVAKRQWEEAKAAFQKALVLSPQNPAASNDLAFVMLQTGGSPDLAMPLAETARRGLPDSPQVADTMGWVLYQKGAYGSAAGQFEEALKLGAKAKSPDNPTVHFHLGMAYEKLGQAGLARQHLQRVLKINPTYSQAEDIKKMLSGLKG